MRNGYCKLFIDSDLRKSEIVDIIRRHTKGSAVADYVDSARSTFDVRDNDEHSFLKVNGNDGFLYYRFYVDVEPTHPENLDAYVAELRTLMSTLRALGAKVVPACDFEERLR